MSLRLMSLPLYFNPTLPLMLSPNYVSSCQPDSNKRKGEGSLFCSWCRRKFFLRLSMISWGQFYVMEIFCNFLNVTFFWSNYNLELRSYGQLFVLIFLLPIYIWLFVYELAKTAHISLPFNLIVHILYLLYIYLGWGTWVLWMKVRLQLNSLMP